MRRVLCRTVLAILLALCLVGPALAVEYSSTDTPLDITDDSNTRSTITVAAGETITDVNVRINITHTYVSDLTITLTGPSGQWCVLAMNPDGGGDNFTNTVFDDEAITSIDLGSAPFTGSFIPNAPLSLYDGSSNAGDWHLDVFDGYDDDTGSLVSWCLIFNSGPTDETAPVITINSANPRTLWPPNGKNRTIEFAGNICDAESALAVTRCVVEDEYGDCDGTYTLTCEEDGDFYYQLSLPAFRYEEDMDGRVFDVTIYAEDSCGNDASECIQIVVPHDMGRRNNQPPAPG